MSDIVWIFFCLIGLYPFIHYIMLILRGHLEWEIFHDSKDNTEDFEGWKPDDVHEVNAKIWELVDITCLPPILVIGIYHTVNHLTNEGTYTATKLSDSFHFIVVRPKSFQWSLVIIIICYLTTLVQIIFGILPLRKRLIEYELKQRQ